VINSANFEYDFIISSNGMWKCKRGELLAYSVQVSLILCMPMEGDTNLHIAMISGNFNRSQCSFSAANTPPCSVEMPRCRISVKNLEL